MSIDGRLNTRWKLHRIMDLGIKLLNPGNFVLMTIQKSDKTYQTLLACLHHWKNACACVCRRVFTSLLSQSRCAMPDHMKASL